MDKDFVELSRIRPCLAIWDWPVTDVRRQGDMKHKRKILRRKFLRWEKWALKWFYAICQILLREKKKALITFPRGLCAGKGFNIEELRDLAKKLILTK